MRRKSNVETTRSDSKTLFPCSFPCCRTVAAVEKRTVAVVKKEEKAVAAVKKERKNSGCCGPEEIYPTFSNHQQTLSALRLFTIVAKR